MKILETAKGLGALYTPPKKVKQHLVVKLWIQNLQ